MLKTRKRCRINEGVWQNHLAFCFIWINSFFQNPGSFPFLVEEVYTRVLKYDDEQVHVRIHVIDIESMVWETYFFFFLIDLVLCLAHVTSCRLIWNIQQPDLWRRLNYELYTNRCFSPSRKLGKKMKLTKIETYSQKYFRLSNNYWVRV